MLSNCLVNIYVDTDRSAVNLGQGTFFLQWAAVSTETQNWSVRVEEVTFEFSTLNETSIPIPQEISQKRQQKE